MQNHKEIDIIIVNSNISIISAFPEILKMIENLLNNGNSYSSNRFFLIH
jgi:hypothetical protein